jgi:hypothetical protein
MFNAPESQSRTSSPTRNREDLEKAVPTIICREFPEILAPDMREDVKSLRKELRAVTTHRGILPKSLQDTLRLHLDELFHDDAFFGEYPRTKNEETKIWEDIQEIRKDAQTCGEQDRAETEWSHDVIRPLIKSSLRYTAWMENVQLRFM